MRIRNIVSISLFLMLFGCLSGAFAQTTKTETRTASGSVRGETYQYKYTDLDFAETPSWNPETDEAPLSAKQAVAKARENLPRYVQNADTFKVVHILLRSMNNDKWFYQVSFTCRGTTCRDLPTRQFTMVVKMDGTILEPKLISFN